MTNKEAMVSLGLRVRAWLTGDFILPSEALMRGEYLFVGAISALLQRDFEKLDGPLGQIFLQSIRDRWSTELSDASAGEIADFMERYDADQMVGVVNVIKGKMFEPCLSA